MEYEASPVSRERNDVRNPAAKKSSATAATWEQSALIWIAVL